MLRVSVRDDGIGGADPARGSGLVGLRDRVEALGGTVAVDSPRGEGTAIEVALPLDRREALTGSGGALAGSATGRLFRLARIEDCG